jgi:hypothetical protein
MKSMHRPRPLTHDLDAVTGGKLQPTQKSISALVPPIRSFSLTGMRPSFYSALNIETLDYPG